jgi:hypothetical protein
MKTIDYFSVGSDDRRVVVAESNESAVDWITHKIAESTGIVYLLGLEYADSVCVTRLYVFDQIQEIQSILIDIADMSDDENIRYFLQEYTNYEDAYDVALGIRETNPLCYERDSN